MLIELLLIELLSVIIGVNSNADQGQFKSLLVSARYTLPAANLFVAESPRQKVVSPL